MLAAARRDKTTRPDRCCPRAAFGLQRCLPAPPAVSGAAEKGPVIPSCRTSLISRVLVVGVLGPVAWSARCDGCSVSAASTRHEPTRRRRRTAARTAPVAKGGYVRPTVGACATPPAAGRRRATARPAAATTSAAAASCVDGVCCNNACSGTCQACNVPGPDGHLLARARRPGAGGAGPVPVATGGHLRPRRPVRRQGRLPQPPRRNRVRHRPLPGRRTTRWWTPRCAAAAVAPPPPPSPAPRSAATTPPTAATPAAPPTTSAPACPAATACAGASRWAPPATTPTNACPATAATTSAATWPAPAAASAARRWARWASAARSPPATPTRTTSAWSRSRRPAARPALCNGTGRLRHLPGRHRSASRPPARAPA